MLAEKLRAAALSVVPDPYFENVTLLLPGNGTNGAQNNTFLDSSTNNFTITRNGNTTQGTFSPYGSLWSNYFDGSGDYLTFPNNAAFAFGTGAFTIEFWVNSNNLNDSFLLSGRAAIGTMHITYGGYGGTTAGSLRYVGSSTITSGSTLISNNLWNHCAIVRDGSNNITLYVNGVSVGTGTDTTNYTATSGTWYINANDSGPTPGQAGYISNLRIIKGTAVYTSAFTPSTTPLTAITNTSLLTCQSNRFIDNSSNAFTITRNGDVSVQRFSPFSPTAPYAAGTDGGSGYFDGTGDNLSIANNAAFQFGSGDFTVEAWVYAPSNPPGIGSIVSHSDGASASGTQFLVRTEGSNTSVVAAVYSGGTAYVATWSSALPIGQWNHVAFTRSGTSTYLWVNGVQRATASVGSVSLNTTSTALTIGSNASASADNWLGYISGTRITKGAALYTATFTPPTAPPTTTVSSGTVGVLLNFTNAGIFDNAEMNDLETVGNAQISTAQSKFGGGSIYLDGSDVITIPNSEGFQIRSGNFTIEFWYYPETLSVNNAHILDFGDGITGGQNSWNVGFFGAFNPSAIGFLYTYDGSSENKIQDSVALSTGQWYHIAVVVNGTSLVLYKNGVSVASATLSGAIATSNRPFVMGSNQSLSSGYANGYIDDLRITKGIARYTANFTPPTAPFPLL